MMDTGHSRIPVHAASDRQRLHGVLLTKKLLRHKADQAIPVSSLELTTIMCVCENTELYKVLDMFQTGRSHMAAVYPAGVDVNDLTATSETAALGIVTLEDVLEELLEEEIVDETDMYVHVEDPKSTSAEEWRRCQSWTSEEESVDQPKSVVKKHVSLRLKSPKKCVESKVE